MTNNDSMISIITVTRNLIKGGRKQMFIKNLISVHEQTHKNIEHIIIDGDSNDGTVKIIKEYAKAGWLKYLSKTDTGMYEAMNTGIKLAKGEWIIFLNSDDFLHDKAGVENTLKLLRKYKADISYAPVVPLEKEFSKHNPNHANLNPDINSVYWQMPFCHQSMFIRKKILEKLNGFNQNLKMAGDYDLVLRLALSNYKMIKLDIPIVTYSFAGMSETYQNQTLKEVSEIYYKNFKTICKISIHECKNIYGMGYFGITKNLAKALQSNIYFNSQKYKNMLNDSYQNIINLTKENYRLKEELNRIKDSKIWKIFYMFDNFIKLIKVYI